MSDNEKKLFLFDELDDKAKQKAREWWCSDGLDYEWWENVYEDAITIGKKLGIEIEHVLFSGFSSQGDGACFEGRYEYRKGWRKDLEAFAPKDIKLFEIGTSLQALQKRHFYKLFANVKHNGHYYHSKCTYIDIDAGMDGNIVSIEDQDELCDLLREFMDWIYRRLESEYDYLTSDESVEESIRINEYRFDENGNIA